MRIYKLLLLAATVSLTLSILNIIFVIGLIFLNLFVDLNPYRIDIVFGVTMHFLISILIALPGIATLAELQLWLD